MTKLLVAGCSHSRGLTYNLGNDYKQKTWGAKLAKELGVESYVNKARQGSSNDRIFHSVIDQIVGEEKPDILIVQFTYMNRFMPFNARCQHPGMAMKLARGDVSARNFYEKNYNCDIPQQRVNAEVFFLERVLMLQETLKSFGLDYYFLFWDSILDYNISTEVVDHIDWSRVLNKNMLDHNMDTVLHAHGFEFSGVPTNNDIDDCHYKEDAQEFLANGFHDLICNSKYMIRPHINNVIDDLDFMHVYD